MSALYSPSGRCRRKSQGGSRSNSPEPRISPESSMSIRERRNAGKGLKSNGTPRIPHVATCELYSLLSNEILETIGGKLTNLKDVAKWNRTTALRNCDTTRIEASIEREFATAVPMLNDRLIQGDLYSASMSDEIGPHYPCRDPLLFWCIDRGLSDRQQHNKMLIVIHDIVKRFPMAMQLWNAQGNSPLHFFLQHPNNIHITRHDMCALMYNEESFDNHVLLSVNHALRTPLHQALHYKHGFAIIQDLIDSNETVLTMIDDRKYTPLHILIAGFSTGSCTVSMPVFNKLKSNVNHKHPEETLLTQDIHNETPLHMVISRCNLPNVDAVINELVPHLIDSDQQVLKMTNEKITPLGDYIIDTPLHMALRRQINNWNLETVNLLIDKEQLVLSIRSLSSNIGEPEYNTPLHVAIMACDMK